MNRLAPSLLLVLGFLVATGASARADEGVGPLGLTEDESARLEQGFLITHPKAERRGDLRLVGGTAFLLQERRAKEPIISIALWGRRLVATINGATLLSGMAPIGLTTVLPIYVQIVMGRSASQI